MVVVAEVRQLQKGFRGEQLVDAEKSECDTASLVAPRVGRHWQSCVKRVLGSWRRTLSGKELLVGTGSCLRLVRCGLSRETGNGTPQHSHTSGRQEPQP